MNLIGLDAVFISKLVKYTRSLSLSAPDSYQDDISRLIIIGDGTPDDIVALILCHCLNGNVTAGVVKPPTRGTGTFKQMQTLINHNKNLSKVVFLLDQERFSCKNIHNDFEIECRKQKINIMSKKPSLKGRLSFVQCSYGDRNINIILIINGLDEISSEMHAIEDHLLKAASEFGVKQLPDGTCNSKEAWKLLSEREQKEIFSKLLNSTTTNQIFPQQMRGLSRLK